MRNSQSFLILIINALRVRLRTVFVNGFLFDTTVDANFAASNPNKYHMKRLLLLSVFCLAMLGASAEIKYRSIDNIKGTNIVLVDENAPQKVEITNAVLLNNGSEYPAKQIRCDVADGVVTYKLKFKRLTVFKNCKVVLTVNGHKVTVDVQKGMSER